MAEPGIGIELARVRTPEDAVAFVNRFGLLHGHTSLRGRPLKPLREPFTLFEATAYDLRHILETEQLVRRGTKGDAAAIDRLRQLLVIPEDEDMQIWDPEAGEHVTRRAGDVYSPDERWVGADDRTILLNAHEHYVAHALDEGMEGSPVRIHDPAAVGESGTARRVAHRHSPGLARRRLLPERGPGACRPGSDRRLRRPDVRAAVLHHR